MVLAHDFDEYLGRKIYWRVLFLSLSTAVVLIFFIAVALLILAAYFSILVSSFTTISALIDLMNRVSVVYLPLIVGTIFFGPWLCCVLISVSSHPYNQPQPIRWWSFGIFLTLILTLIWHSWVSLMPILAAPSVDLIFLIPLSNGIGNLLLLNLGICILMILVSINVWLRWLTR